MLQLTNSRFLLVQQRTWTFKEIYIFLNVIKRIEVKFISAARSPNESLAGNFRSNVRIWSTLGNTKIL